MQFGRPAGSAGATTTRMSGDVIHSRDRKSKSSTTGRSRPVDVVLETLDLEDYELGDRSNSLNAESVSSPDSRRQDLEKEAIDV